MYTTFRTTQFDNVVDELFCLKLLNLDGRRMGRRLSAAKILIRTRPQIVTAKVTIKQATGRTERKRGEQAPAPVSPGHHGRRSSPTAPEPDFPTRHGRQPRDSRRLRHSPPIPPPRCHDRSPPIPEDLRGIERATRFPGYPDYSKLLLSHSPHHPTKPVDVGARRSITPSDGLYTPRPRAGVP